MFPPHCIAGTAEAEVIPELAKYPGEIIQKEKVQRLLRHRTWSKS